MPDKDRLDISRKILAQLGGRQFLIMTDCKHLVGDKTPCG